MDALNKKIKTKKRRAWGLILSLAGLLLSGVGLSSDAPNVFLGLNILTVIGIIVFIFGAYFLINNID